MVLSNHMINTALTFTSSLRIFLRCFQTSLYVLLLLLLRTSPQLIFFSSASFHLGCNSQPVALHCIFMFWILNMRRKLWASSDFM